MSLIKHKFVKPTMDAAEWKFKKGDMVESSSGVSKAKIVEYWQDNKGNVGYIIEWSVGGGRTQRAHALETELTKIAGSAMDGGDYQSNSQAELSKAMQSLRNVSSIARSAVRNYSPSKIKATSNELKMFVDSQISIWSDMARSAEKANEILNGIAIPASTIKVPLKDKSAREEFNMFFT